MIISVPVEGFVDVEVVGVTDSVAARKLAEARVEKEGAEAGRSTLSVRHPVNRASYATRVHLSTFHCLPRGEQRAVAYAGNYVVTVPYPPGPGVTGNPAPTFELAMESALSARDTASKRRAALAIIGDA